MKTVKCKQCRQTISAVLSPFEKFEKQLRRLSEGFCSTYCERLIKGKKS